MSKVIWHVTMSLDGFIAGPDDSMDWVVREWSDDGTTTRDIEVDGSPVADEVMHSVGAILGGRRWYDVAERLYDGVDGIYGGQWQGPVFVLTHRPPDDTADDTVTFVSTPLPEAVAAARTAADGKNVVVFGANVAQQCLREGLLDEIVIHLAPVLLGDGIRLFAASDSKPVTLRRTTLAESGQITDLRFSVLN
ncbi:MAG: dihydrofolate reductase family protein [Acidimicrobiales bacterium]